MNECKCEALVDLYVTSNIETRRIRKWSTQILNYINSIKLYSKKAGAKISRRKLYPYHSSKSFHLHKMQGGILNWNVCIHSDLFLYILSMSVFIFVSNLQYTTSYFTWFKTLNIHYLTQNNFYIYD
jgi:hypothetical protein